MKEEDMTPKKKNCERRLEERQKGKSRSRDRRRKAEQRNWPPDLMDIAMGIGEQHES